MDSKISISTEQTGEGFYVAQFKTADLSIFSYYIESNSQAVIIDPTIDIKIYQEIIAKRNANLKYVCLTHYHADFLSGHTQFKVPIIMGKDCKRSVNSFDVLEY